MRILVIDGALNHSGWVLLDDRGGNGWEGVNASTYGRISCRSTESLGFKLNFLRGEIIKLIKSTRAEKVVLEETYAGNNALTTSRLNNAKGVITQAVFELLGKDPVMVRINECRSCLGFVYEKKEDRKKQPFEFFSKMYKLTESYAAGNDITDAFTLGWGYILYTRGECAKKKRNKNIKKAVANKVKEETEKVKKPRVSRKK
jgi:Holliday junction resolvasome RuvABC endonuclease subunit